MKKQKYRTPSSFEIFTKCDLRNRFSKFRTIKKCRASKLEKPIFIVGCPRSGTTVLGKCLAAHPKIAGDKESLFLMLLWILFDEMHQGNNKKNFASLDNFINANEIVSNACKFTDNIFLSVLTKQKKSRYVDHTPWYVLLAPFIDLMYPNALFVHIVRDGRKVVNSLTNSYNKGFSWAGQNIMESTQLWANLIKHGLSIKNNLPDRYLEIKYENFCQEPTQTLTKVLNFTGLKFDKKVLKPLTIIHTDSVAKNIASSLRNLNTSWPKRWSDKDKKDFLLAGGSLMRKLYPNIDLR